MTDEVEQANDTPAVAVGTMRDAIFTSLARFLDLETAEHLGMDFAIAVQEGIGNAGGLIEFLSAQRDLVAVDTLTDQVLCEAMLELPVEARRAMMLGYLGYALYDIATLPLLQDEGFDEFDPVKVDRISPDDAPTIRSGGAVATLKGIEFNNFGAFFSRAYRENDYLWGRLHGVDRLIDILISSLPETGTIGAEDRLRYKHLAFHAILDQEEVRLTKVKPLIESLRAEVDA
ncbi:MAG: DUF3376 domain-containing protein, partial [Gammaproteobacteria bacterium]